MEIAMRQERTSADFREAAKQLVDVADILNDVASDMDTAGLKSLLFHGEAAMNRYIPALRKWAAATRVDCDTQVKSYLLGVESVAQMNKAKSAQNAARKRSRK